MSGSLKKVLGLRVRAARQHRDLTQEELAAQIGRTPESVSNIERGLQLPSLDTLVELGRILGVPVAEFFDEDSGSSRSAERVSQEARLREVARSLTDRDLDIAIKQLSAFLSSDHATRA